MRQMLVEVDDSKVLPLRCRALHEVPNEKDVLRL
jgi:hypothetical protein